MHTSDPYNGPTAFEKIVALGALLVVAIVVVAVGWFGLTVWLSAIEYMESAVR